VLIVHKTNARLARRTSQQIRPRKMAGSNGLPGFVAPPAARRPLDGPPRSPQPPADGDEAMIEREITRAGQPSARRRDLSTMPLQRRGRFLIRCR
jgi:hypothetical protein